MRADATAPAPRTVHTSTDSLARHGTAILRRVSAMRADAV